MNYIWRNIKSWNCFNNIKFLRSQITDESLFSKNDSLELEEKSEGNLN